MSFGASAEMPISVALANPEPDLITGSGLGTTVHPFGVRCSMRACAVRLRPTAQTLPPPKLTTPSRMDFDPPLVAGFGTIVHVVPSKCAVIGSRLAKLVRLMDPTAHTSL